MELGDMVAIARDSKAPMKTSLSISTKGLPCNGSQTKDCAGKDFANNKEKEKSKTRCSIRFWMDKILHMLITD